MTCFESRTHTAPHAYIYTHARTHACTRTHTHTYMCEIYIQVCVGGQGVRIDTDK